jgi:aminoglycoside phosphotransferase (APT) family kinase protein
MSFVAGTSLDPLFDPGVETQRSPGRTSGRAERSRPDVAERSRPENEDDSATVVAARMRNAARTMAALHALDPDGLGLADEPLVGPADEIDRWCAALETVDPAFAPGWESVAAALRARVPPALASAVVHGDFRLGNMLAVGERITAVIDWEIWSIGDPRVDVGWYLTTADRSTYRRATRYGGALPTPAELAHLYGTALGRDVLDLDWFQALACFKSTAVWALIVKHNRRRTAPNPAIEEMAGVLPHLLEQTQVCLARSRQ